jgi:hypothetical protein
MESYLRKILKEAIIKVINEETDFFNINELKIDELNSYDYENANYLEGKNNISWKFTDRCNNEIYAVYNTNIHEFKTGFKIDGSDTIIFQPEKFPEIYDKIHPCPDDKKVNTIYKILIKEIIPDYLLNKKPSKLFFNPVSQSRNRLVKIIINKIAQNYPEIEIKNNYLINI